MKRFACLLALGLALNVSLAHTSLASSFSIEPFKAQLMPARGKTSQVFRFANTGDTPQAINMAIESWAFDANGTEINQPDTESFTIYPQQFVLPPRSEQRVRVTWTKPMPETEQAFRLIAEQLPVDFSTVDSLPTGAEQALRYLLVYRAALYVTPPKARNEVDVQDFTTTTDATGQRWLDLTLANAGRAHTLLKNPTLTLEDTSGQSHNLSGASMDTLNGQNNMAGGLRKVRVPLPATATNEIKAVALDFTAGL